MKLLTTKNTNNTGRLLVYSLAFIVYVVLAFCFLQLTLKIDSFLTTNN